MKPEKRPMTISFTVPRYWRAIALRAEIAWDNVTQEIVNFKNYYASRPEIELTDAGWERRWRLWVVESKAKQERFQEPPSDERPAFSFHPELASFHVKQALAILKR